MIRPEKRLLRLAVDIHEQLKTQEALCPVDSWPALTWQRCETLRRRMHRAHERGWHLAAQRLQRDLRELVRRTHAQLIEVERQLDPLQGCRHVASIHDIHADLGTLYEEFDDVSVERRSHTISVTTEPIVLEGVYLGPFEIRLDWGDLVDGHPHNYRVVALDANPAAANEGVTHPHVQDEAVCEGDGHLPIREALTTGRLLDFFVIVANLLRTYNSGSPFVSLDEWHGIACSDCGMTVSDDDRWMCENCESAVCGECVSHCRDCDCVFCAECVTHCDGCSEYYCRSCMTRCSQCRDDLCKNCLVDEERCENCYEEEQEEETREDAHSPGEVTGEQHVASVQPTCLGEASVSA